MLINLKKLKDLINSSNTCILETNNNYMYHGIFIPGFKDVSPVLSIVNNGILSIHELRKLGISIGNSVRTSNGKYYICLSSNKNHFDRIFDIGFIVERSPDYIKADSKSKLAYFLWNTPFPLREGLEDEYQVYGGIAPEKIIGIQLRFDELLKDIPENMKISENEYISRIIKAVNDIYDKIEEKGLSIPIINSNNNKIIDRELFKTLKNYEEMSMMFAHILKEIQNIGDSYEFLGHMPNECDEFWNFIGCSTERQNFEIEKCIITRIRLTDNFEELYVNENNNSNRI